MTTQLREKDVGRGWVAHSRAHPALQLFSSCPSCLLANGTKVSSDAWTALPGQIDRGRGR